ncbi:uncharacterized protein LOC135220062 [Macrobrachium nipponense]|uniref:uncharacterized protein LOC135220062 n=1 Tax=Macrobrachium nipponense TaxID=159736 RepID=UPI0030C85C6D
MKRLRESAPDAPDSSNKKKCATRWSSKKEQRSGGVVTVEASSSSASSAAFKLSDTTPSPAPTPPTPAPLPPPPPLASSAFPPPSRINEPSEFLTELRKCAFPALRDSALIPKLLDCVMRKFLLVPNKLSWGEECEAVFTLLYVCLHYPTTVTPQFAEEVASEFVGRWVADSGAGSLGDIAVLIAERNKCSSFALLLLLIGNHVPEKVDKFHLEACISWSNGWSPDSRAPDWLIDALGHNENIYSLKSMLFTSYMLLKGQPWTLEVRDNYTGVLVQYLAACKLYRESDYYESLSLLHEINLEECGTSLQGWVLWSTGLCLFKLGKSSTALVKLQEAIDKSNSSVPAIFNVSQVFRKMGISSAEVETLSLLVAIGQDWQPYQSMNLQSAILRLHNPPPDNLLSIAHFILGARCFCLKMYEESCNSIAVLLQNLQDTPVVPTTNHRTLFCVEDDLPGLPDYDNIVVLQSLASFQRGNYEVIVTNLDQLGENGEYSNYYRDSSNIKMAHICAATFRFVKSEALLKLGKTEESLVECIRYVYQQAVCLKMK